MRDVALNILAVFFGLTALYLFFFPVVFYENTPGLAAMGPYNLHFIRDVSFAFFVSGAALGYGVRVGLRELAMFGAAWPLLHAFFHLYIWAHRGFPFDVVWASDLTLVVIPGIAAFALAAKITKS